MQSFSNFIITEIFDQPIPILDITRSAEDIEYHFKIEDRWYSVTISPNRVHKAGRNPYICYVVSFERNFGASPDEAFLRYERQFGTPQDTMKVFSTVYKVVGKVITDDMGSGDMLTFSSFDHSKSQIKLYSALAMKWSKVYGLQMTTNFDQFVLSKP